MASFQDFLKTYKPEHKIWASKALDADVKAPEDVKLLQGWTIEKPRHNFFNWHMKRTDERLEHLEARIAWLESILKEQGTNLE